MEKEQKNKLKVCFVAPHPDDIELYCGGTLLAHSNHDDVSVLMMTKGGLGTRNKKLKGKPMETIREQEALARYALLDQVQLIFAGFYDGSVICDASSISTIHALLQELNPDIIYIPEYQSKLSQRDHADHLNTGNIIFNSSQFLKKKVTLRCYHSRAVNLLINIDEYFEQNNRAIEFYQSQLGSAIWPFKTKLILWNHRHNKKRTRWGKKIGARYAEGFRELCVGSQSELI